MSKDQIYELLKMIITTIIPIIAGIFGGYQWAKNTIKINISQTQFNELKNSVNVSTKEITSQITELNNIIKANIRTSSESISASPVTINIGNTALPYVGSTGSGYNPLAEALRKEAIK